MHRIDSGTYVGQPGELVTVGTQVDGGGQISVTLDGQPLGGSTFNLPANAESVAIAPTNRPEKNPTTDFTNEHGSILTVSF